MAVSCPRYNQAITLRSEFRATDCNGYVCKRVRVHGAVDRVEYPSCVQQDFVRAAAVLTDSKKKK